MQSSIDRVAARYFWKAAAYPGSINDFIERTWLPDIGEQIVRKIGGRYIVAFDRGFVLKVWLHRISRVEYLGLRFNSYKAVLDLHYVDPDGKDSLLDSMEMGQMGKLSPKKLAEWALRQVPPPPPDVDPRQERLF